MREELPGTIAIVGAGPEGERLVDCCLRAHIDIAMIVDDNPALVGKCIRTLKVEPFFAIYCLWASKIPVVVASHIPLRAVVRLPGLRVIPLSKLQTDWPEEFPPHPFVTGWAQDFAENEREYRWLHKVLVDRRSKNVLKAVLAYRRDGDVLALERMRTRDLYAPPVVPWAEFEEIVVDAGAYRGDTVDLWRARGARRVFAFEPDRANYIALLEHCAEWPEVTCFNAGLYSHDGKVAFEGEGRAASAGGSGWADVVTLDSLALQPTFIKMNIEGAEPEALGGARQTIEHCKPTLALSVYHRADHLWRIARLVRSFAPSYELFLRQHEGGCVETVLYAVHQGSHR
jgi:FkbM family methyltransferase